MKFYLNNLLNFFKKNSTILSFSLYVLLVSTLFITFFYSISQTSNNFSFPHSSSKEIYTHEESANVGTFITDSNEDANIDTKILSYINDFFSTRNQSFLTGNVENLYKFYDLSHSYSKYSLHHEFKRIAYLRDWANDRGITFETITSTPYIKNIQVIDNIAKLDIDETFSVSYFYTANPTVKNHFSITLFHNEELQIIGDGFTIQKDYFFDSFENALKKYKFTLNEKQLPLKTYKTYNIKYNRSNLNFKKNRTYNRFAAVTYADTYSGVLTDNHSIGYNPNYFNASSLSYGGNSTNFVSQCLGGTNNAGSLKQDKTWFYNSTPNNSPKVSDAWINPKDLKDYLIYSAKGTLIKEGNLENLLAPLSDGAKPFSKLQIGDLIFYTKGAFPMYSSIITSFDSNGYPLVNSNTVNRFHVPFDLGWSDDDITFQLVTINQ